MGMYSLTFDKNRNRVDSCPCGKSNSDLKFSPYVGFDDKGYCHSCAKSFLPEDGKVYELPPPVNSDESKVVERTKRTPPPETSYFPPELVELSLKCCRRNNFSSWLTRLFSDEVASSLCTAYRIGTSKRWYGANVFWQCDTSGNYRSGKIMLYNGDGHRVKNCTNWAHIAAGMSNFSLKQCFFGEHLLRDTSKRIAIVESEKTAIVSSVYFPEFTWIASCGVGGLSQEKCSVLRGREVVLFPDLGKYDDWNKASARLRALCEVSTSDSLEQIAVEYSINIQKGYDLADFLIQYTPAEFMGIELPKQFEPTTFDGVSYNVEPKSGKCDYPFFEPSELPDIFKRYEQYQESNIL